VFAWDRVDFHKKPGGDRVGPADPNWPNKWGIRYHVTSCSVLRGAKLAKGRLIVAGEHAGHQAVRQLLCVFGYLYILVISIMVVSVSFLCCSVKQSLSQSMSFAIFFQFSSPPHRKEEKQNSHVVLCC